MHTRRKPHNRPSTLPIKTSPTGTGYPIGYPILICDPTLGTQYRLGDPATLDLLHQR